MALTCAKQITALFCIVILFSITACRNDESQPADVNDNIVCPMLYQGDSLAEALEFIELPEEDMENRLSSVTKWGELARQDELLFANRLFSIRKSKDVNMFKSLLSSRTRKHLDDDNKRMAHLHIDQIKSGTFIYGEYDFKFFATFGELTQVEKDSLKRNASYAQEPSHVLRYWHFHKPKHMLISGPFYLIKDKRSYRVIDEAMFRGELPSVTKQKEAARPKKYGITAFVQNDDAYDKKGVHKYEWDIQLKLEESKANTFELLRLTKVVSAQGNIELDPDIARRVIVKQEVFDKYKYKELKCSFKVGREEPGGKFGIGLSGWGYSFDIASLTLTGSIIFPGKDVTNIKPNKEGGFVGDDLEFISFDTSEEGVKYNNRVVLRKRPLATKPGS